MKILWLYKYDASYNFDKWFHLEYVRWMKNNGYDIVAYGPGIHDAYPDIAVIPWDPNTTWDFLLTRLKPDVVILNTKSRMFDFYSPFTKTMKGCILPKGFIESKQIPKVVIEEDYHYEDNDDWYLECGCDLLIQRHYSQYLRGGNLRVEWLPFSVDTDMFRPDNIVRRRKFCFIGSISSAYPERRLLCDFLAKKGILHVYESHQKLNMDYIKSLQSYFGFLSTSSIYDICAAKNFEILSCGAVLITNKFSGLDLLFPSNAYCEIPVDPQKAYTILLSLIHNSELCQSLITAGRQCILEKHSNFTRTKELMYMLRSL